MSCHSAARHAAAGTAADGVFGKSSAARGWQSIDVQRRTCCYGAHSGCVARDRGRCAGGPHVPSVQTTASSLRSICLQLAHRAEAGTYRHAQRRGLRQSFVLVAGTPNFRRPARAVVAGVEVPSKRVACCCICGRARVVPSRAVERGMNGNLAEADYLQQGSTGCACCRARAKRVAFILPRSTLLT